LSAEILGAFSSIRKRTCGQASAEKAGGDVGRRNELNAPALLADARRCPTCLRGTRHALHARAAAACALERKQAASLQPLAPRAVSHWSPPPLQVAPFCGGSGTLYQAKVSQIVAIATSVNFAKKGSNTGSSMAFQKDVTGEEHRVRLTARGDGGVRL